MQEWKGDRVDRWKGKRLEEELGQFIPSQSENCRSRDGDEVEAMLCQRQGNTENAAYPSRKTLIFSSSAR